METIVVLIATALYLCVHFTQCAGYDVPYTQHYSAHLFALAQSNQNPIFPTLPFSNVQQMVENYILTSTELYSLESDHSVTRLDQKMSLVIAAGTRIGVTRSKLLFVVTPTGYHICKGLQCVFHIMNFGPVSSVAVTEDESMWVGSAKGLTFIEGAMGSKLDMKLVQRLSAYVNTSVTCVSWSDKLQTVVLGVADRYIRISMDTQALSFQYVPGVVESTPSALAFVPSGSTLDVWIGNALSIAVEKATREMRRIGGYFDSFEYGTGLPYNNISCIVVNEETSDVWIGTGKGAVRYHMKTNVWHYYYGNRWIIGQSVSAISLRKRSATAYSAWIATEAGLSEIVVDLNWTLEQKQAFYQSTVYPFHDREGLIEQCSLPSYGNLSTCTPGSSDNDGLWTAVYIASQCFRYAATKDPEARRNALHSFEALEKLNKITGVRGLMARSFTKYGENPEGGIWYNSTVYPGYVWKADTSSDEVTGHLFVYPLIYDLVAQTPEEKKRAYDLINNITSYIVDNDFTLVDITGKITTWGIWRPDILNSPEHYGERGGNSIEILAYLASAYRITKNKKFLNAFKYLAETHNYKENIINARLTSTTEINYSDDELFFLAYMTYFYAVKGLQAEGLFNPEDFAYDHFLLSLNRTYNSVKTYKPSLYNYFYAYATGSINSDLIEDSLWNLRTWALNQIDFPMFNSHRLDIVKNPNLDRRYKLTESTNLLPCDERITARWNGDPYAMDYPGGGGTYTEPSAWLIAYWFGRFIKAI